MVEKKTINYMRILILCLWGIGIVKILFVGYDIDEQYALAMSYRMTQGDFLVYNMWEPHQTSGFLMAVFMLPYIMITGGTTGIVLYVRICGLICHVVIHGLLYKTLCTYLNREHGLLVCGISFFALPKLMFLPEFANMQIWFLLLTGICLLKYYGTERVEKKRGKIIYLIAAGFFTALEVFTYPSTVFAFIGIIAFIILFYKKGLLVQELIAYILPCIISAGVVMGILLMKIPVDMLGRLLGQVASDGSHSTTFTQWIMRHAYSGTEMMVYMVIYATIATVLYFVLKKIGLLKNRCMLWVKIWIVCAFVGQVVIWLFGDQYPNYPSIEYFMVVVLPIVLFSRKKVKMSPVFAFLYIIPILTFIGILVFSNHPIMPSLPFLCTGVVGCLSLPEIKEIWKNEEGNLKSTGIKAVLFLWLLVMVFGKCYLIRSTGGQHITVFDDVSLMRDGVAKGIIAEDYVISSSKEIDSLISEYVPEGSRLFYMGNYSDIYLLQNVEVCSPSTISTPTYGKNVEIYFALYPDKKPEYVALSKFFVNPAGGEWIENYISTNCEEEPIAENWCIKLYKHK